MVDTYIGATNTGGSVVNPVDGYVRLPAIWNDALSDSDIMLLAMGAHPRTVRPDALVAYWELEDEGFIAQSMSRDGAGLYPMTEFASPLLISEEPWQLNKGVFRPGWMGADTLTPAGTDAVTGRGVVSSSQAPFNDPITQSNLKIALMGSGGKNGGRAAQPLLKQESQVPMFVCQW